MQIEKLPSTCILHKIKGGEMLAKDSAQFDSISAVAVDFLSGFMQALLGFPTQVSNESFGCFPCLKILPIGFLISLCYTEADTPLLFTDTVHLRQQMERVVRWAAPAQGWLQVRNPHPKSVDPDSGVKTFSFFSSLLLMRFTRRQLLPNRSVSLWKDSWERASKLSYFSVYCIR